MTVVLLVVIAVCCLVMASETIILGVMAFGERRRQVRARKLAAAVYAKVKSGEITAEDALAQLRAQAGE